METWFTPFEPQPAPDELPAAFPSPFDEQGPHPLAQRAAEVMRAELRSGFVAPGIPTRPLEGAEGGKMFGVLVVREPGAASASCAPSPACSGASGPCRVTSRRSSMPGPVPTSSPRARPR
ncbi:hypothetical protein ACN28S_47900 [Cystobacter fuscus]